jgi:hypothetical protein
MYVILKTILNGKNLFSKGLKGMFFSGVAQNQPVFFGNLYSEYSISIYHFSEANKINFQKRNLHSEIIKPNPVKCNN